MLHAIPRFESLRFMARRHSRYCDGITRRDAIRAGMAASGALSLPGIMALQAANRGDPEDRSHNAVIFVSMGGGPTQHETYDPKPKAPSEYRGPFGVIDTTLPGEFQYTTADYGTITGFAEDGETVTALQAGISCFFR